MNKKMLLVFVWSIMIALPVIFGLTIGQAREMSNTIHENQARLASQRAMGNGCVELLSNGSFESGSISPWVESSNHAETLLSTVRPRESTYSVLFGNANRADDQLYQEIILPLDATSLTLSYWYTTFASDSPRNDVLSVTLRSGKGERLRTLTSIDATTNLDWQQGTHDLMDYRGQSVQIHFRGVTDSNNHSDFSLDDISVQACGVTLPTATPTTSGQYQLFLPLILSGGEATSVSSPTPTATASHTATPTSTPTSTPTNTPTSTRTFMIEPIQGSAIEGGVPNAMLLKDGDGNDTVVLIYSKTGTGLIEATSSDGLNFSNIGVRYDELNNIFGDQELFPSDVIIRQTESGTWRYFIKGLAPPKQGGALLYAADRASDNSLQLLNSGQPIYEGGPNDAERIEVLDIIKTLDDKWRGFYVAVGATPGNSRTAISSDEGQTWAFESDNPFGDINNEQQASLINVDPAPLKLQDGTYMAVTMRATQLYFWNSTDGLTFTQVENLVFSADHVNHITENTTTGLFDPSIVQLPDGTIYMYVTAGSQTTDYVITAKITVVGD